MLFWLVWVGASGVEGVPHVLPNDTYDRSWEAAEVVSTEELDSLVQWQATLVGAIMNEEKCAYDPLSLRQGQRHRPAEFMRTVVARRDKWKGEWPFLQEDCSLAMWYEDSARARRKVDSLDSSVDSRHAVVDFVQQSSRVQAYTFENKLDEPVSIYWFDASQEEGMRSDPWKLVAEGVGPGERKTISTFVSHVFAVAEDETFVAFFSCRGEDDRAEIVEGTCGGDEIHDQARELVYGYAMQKRLALSDVQTNLVPNVTADGFKLVDVPPKTFGKILAFYAKNHDALKEIEGDGGPLYNQRFVDTWHTPLTPKLKTQVFEELKVLMEEWAPTTAPLHGTSAYGVRTYTNGSYLHLHADTANTHVVSGIINVDQKVDKPWPVQIFDHDGKLHRINMKPGDMLLYESAKLLHGRFEPLDGEYYANVFVHYAPPEWNVHI